MGYTLAIGEAKIESYEEDGLEASCYIKVNAARKASAPAFGEPTDYTNERWPSYTSWYNFCEYAKILPTMYYMNIDGSFGNFRGGHPGAFPINKEFKEAIDTAYNRLKMQAKTLDPDADIFETDLGGAWARIQWVKYWTDWALENCTTPVLVNS